jgi:heat shock protein HslJ
LVPRSPLIWVGVICAQIVVSAGSAVSKPSPHGLENRRWRIARYRGDGTKKGDEQGLVEAAKPAEITFAKNRIHGSAGCGALDGTYQLSGNQLTVHADFVLAGLCLPEQFAQNQQILNAFKGDLRVEQVDDHIVLLDTSGQARVLLVPY